MNTFSIVQISLEKSFKWFKSYVKNDFLNKLSEFRFPRIKVLVFSFLLAGISIDIAAQVAINTDESAPESSAMLDVKSNSKGILIPRMTTTQRNNIENPALGLMVYDTNKKTFWYYDGQKWRANNAIPEILDADEDTRVTVEEFSDEDRVKIAVAGEQNFVLDSN